MRVGDYMHTDVITIPSDILLLEALKIMKDHDIRRLPVVDDGKLVGLVTKDKLMGLAPEPAVRLSTWELNYMLSKVKVGGVMETNLFTVTPDVTIETAVTEGQKRRVGSVLVTKDKDGRELIGILTTTDIHKLLTQILGFGEQPHERLHIHNCSKSEFITRVIDIIMRHKVGIHTLFSVAVPRSKTTDTIIHLDTTDASQIVAELRSRGFTVEVNQQ